MTGDAGRDARHLGPSTQALYRDDEDSYRPLRGHPRSE
jgi:hypothetical protein